jgi:hypothetical protein
MLIFRDSGNESDSPPPVGADSVSPVILTHWKSSRRSWPFWHRLCTVKGERQRSCPRGRTSFVRGANGNSSARATLCVRGSASSTRRRDGTSALTTGVVRAPCGQSLRGRRRATWTSRSPGVGAAREDGRGVALCQRRHGPRPEPGKQSGGRAARNGTRPQGRAVFERARRAKEPPRRGRSVVREMFVVGLRARCATVPGANG